MDVVKERNDFMITQINFNKPNYNIKQYNQNKIYDNLSFKSDCVEISKNNSNENSNNKLKTAAIIGLGIILFFLGFRIGIINNVMFRN